MNFIQTKLAGVYIVEAEKVEDERGFFARTFCQNEFRAHGLNPQLVQCSLSYNKKKGTLRGLHYQAAPHSECKLVRCTRGAIYDVAVDLRPESPTLNQWVAIELAAHLGRMMYIPEGCAHGFQTLVDDAEVFYQMSEFFHPECARRIRWDSPRFGICWPIAEVILSAQDRNCPIPEKETLTYPQHDATEAMR